MKKIFSGVMVAALFVSAISCTPGSNSSTTAQSAQEQSATTDGIPEGGEWIKRDGSRCNGDADPLRPGVAAGRRLLAATVVAARKTSHDGGRRGAQDKAPARDSLPRSSHLASLPMALSGALHPPCDGT